MRILLLEPYYSGSHQHWAEEYKCHSRHEVNILSLPGRHWKWRMHGGAVSLAQQFMSSNFIPDLILATDMLNLSTFMALSRSKISQIPIAIYFHENQIGYPWSPTDPDVVTGWNNHYGFINYSSALAADAVFFNSNYHLHSFLNSLPLFLQQFPDYRETSLIKRIRQKSHLLPLGLSLKRFNLFQFEEINDFPILLWNHRWEYDKNPEAFFSAVFRLKDEGVSFKLIVLGKNYRRQPPIFKKAKLHLKSEILHFDFASNFENYARWLWKADILPVTSNQDFFGRSVVEAMYCNCLPILPHRLAFPEHIPVPHRISFCYDSADEFYSKLKHNCIHYKEVKKAISFQDFVTRYDWSTLASEYDKVFEELVVNR